MNKRALLLSEGGCNVPQNLRIQNYLQRRKCMTFEIHSNITNRSMTVAARAMRKVLTDTLPCDDWDAHFAPEEILTEKGIQV